MPICILSDQDVPGQSFLSKGSWPTPPPCLFFVFVVVVDPGFVGQSVVVVHKDYLSQSAFFLIKMFLANLFDHDYLGHLKKKWSWPVLYDKDSFSPSTFLLIKAFLADTNSIKMSLADSFVLFLLNVLRC